LKYVKGLLALSKKYNCRPEQLHALASTILLNNSAQLTLSGSVANAEPDARADREPTLLDERSNT